MDLIDPEGTAEAQSEPTQPDVAGDEPTGLSTTQRLQELRAWFQKVQEEQELHRLLEIKRRVEQGDTSALQEGQPSAPQPYTAPAEPNNKTPRPEKPTQFANRDRAEYNRWERECEATFRGSPKNFYSEATKIDFGIRYISNTLRTLWDAYSHDNQRKSDRWQPTWTEFKTVMLNALGPQEQRKLAAHQALKSIKQDWNQDPNDLLSKLDTLWTELGQSYPEEQRIMDFVGALLPTVQKDLLLLEPEQRSSITDVNSRARLIWNRYRREKPQRPGEGKSTHSRTLTNERGVQKTWKKPRRDGPDHKGPNWGNKAGNREKPSNENCFKCGKPGHIARGCRESNVSNSGAPDDNSEKGKGSKGK